MSEHGEDRAQGFAAESLKGSRLKPGQSGGIHAEAGDHVLSNHSLTGRDQHEDFAQAQKLPGRAGDAPERNPAGGSTPLPEADTQAG